MEIKSNTIPANLTHYMLHDFNHIRIASNDYKNINYMIERGFTLLFEELDYIKDIYLEGFDDSDWLYKSGLDTNDQITLEYFNSNIARLYGNQNLIKDALENISPVTDDFRFGTDKKPAYSLDIGMNEFMDNDIINRILYRLWKNNRQIKSWLVSYKIGGLF